MSATGTDCRPLLGTRLVGAAWHCYDSIDSTNLEALRLARAGAPLGTVVIAATQTSGRGRLGRTWVDLPGRCLLLSVLLAPPRGTPGMLTAAAALAAAEAVDTAAGVRSAIKWPNDLLVADRKIAGILAEGPVAGMMAVGVGINVNGTPEELPDELRGRASFLSHEGGRSIAVATLADELARRLDAVYHLLMSGCSDAVIKSIAGRDCLAGRRIEARRGHSIIRGEVRGWLPDGRLLVRDEHDSDVVLEAGEVTLL